jgi:hypothetical protein
LLDNGKSRNLELPDGDGKIATNTTAPSADIIADVDGRGTEVVVGIRQAAALLVEYLGT